jgi:hypothetical protein
VSEPPTVPAGWYVDPNDATQYRYWNGSTWTADQAPVTVQVPPAALAPAPPAQNANRYWPWFAGGAVLLLIIYAATTWGSNGATPLTNASAQPTGFATASTAGIGDPVRDGKFEFTVLAVKCGIHHVGGSFGETAQGQFCLARMTVKNIGMEPQTFNASDQIAYDSAGNQMEADSMASSESAFLQDINPGNQVTGVVAFDIPTDQTLTFLELHDSTFSNGITVTL